jgi:hypothetical protein
MNHVGFPGSRLIYEVYNALHSGGMCLAVMGARTLVDMAIMDKVGDVGSFEEKLEALEQKGFIGKQNRKILLAALEAGHATAHRGHEYTEAQVNQVMDIVENMLQAIYALESCAEQLKKVTPPRKRGTK